MVDILFGMNISTRCEVRACAALGGLFLASLAASATPVSLSNPSFELPATGFVDTRVDGWSKTPAPVWFDPVLAGGASWDQVSGVFANPPVGQATRKANIDGNQALYLFALPTAGLTQTLSATYEAGVSYTLTLGVTGGGGNLPEGSTFLLGFYYVDGASAVPLGATTVTHSLATFPTTTSFVDFSATVPTVGAGDAWAGKPIGLQLIATSGTGVGYWDLDNVRLEATVVPEPGTWALLGTGAGLLLVAGWRRNVRG